MRNALRKALLFGLGSVEYSREKLELFVKGLEEEGITREEGKKLVDDVMSNAKDYTGKQKKEMKKFIKEVFDELGVLTKEDLEEIKKSAK